MKVPILDLSGQYRDIKREIEVSLAQTMQNGDFILGREEVLFEKEFAGYCKRKSCVGVNSGTDALFLSLLSLGIGKGDEVILPVFTYIATAFAITYTGAKPVFVDIHEGTYNIEVNKIKDAITKKTKAIIPVHLYGQSADMYPLLDIARKYGLKIIEDAAQAHGARYKMPDDEWRIAGGMGDIGCFSFYPTKNLSAFGDAGAIVADQAAIYKKLLMLRDYGRRTRYEHVTLGYNSRLDTLQAAVLRKKIKHLDKWNNMRRRNAKIYTQMLKGIEGIIAPQEAGYARHIYHQYVIRVKNREKVVRELAKKGIATLIHYPIPLHLQPVYKNLGYKRGDFPVAEKVAKEVISLPMYPHLKQGQIEFIADTLKRIIKN